jgi:hypothetical protein
MAGIGHNSGRGQNIVRANPEQGYTKLSNAFLQDSRVSYETRGLLAEILSRPDDWEITIAALVKSGPAGRDKVYRMMQEAVKCGYAEPKKDRRGDGAFQRHSYRVTDDPRLLIEQVAAEIMEMEGAPFPENQEVEPLPENPEVAKPEVDARQAISGESGSGESAQPLSALPDTANPTRTNKRELQRKDTDTSLRSVSAGDDDTLDPKEVVWSNGLRWLAKATGDPEKRLRSVIGKWLKAVTFDELLHAMRSAKAAKTGDPIAYIWAIVEQAKQTEHAVRREKGRLVVMNGFKAEIETILAGYDLQESLDIIAGRIPIGLSGIELETKVRGLAREMVKRETQQDRRYANARADNARRAAESSLAAKYDAQYEGVL